MSPSLPQQKATGAPLSSLISTHVTTPLEMRDTGSAAGTTDAPGLSPLDWSSRVAPGHAEDGAVTWRNSSYGVLHGNGFLTSSLADMAVLARAMLGHAGGEGDSSGTGAERRGAPAALRAALAEMFRLRVQSESRQHSAVGLGVQWYAVRGTPVRARPWSEAPPVSCTRRRRRRTFPRQLRASFPPHPAPPGPALPGRALHTPYPDPPLPPLPRRAPTARVLWGLRGKCDELETRPLIRLWQVWWKDGDTEGYSSLVAADAAAGRAVVVLDSCAGCAHNAERQARGSLTQRAGKLLLRGHPGTAAILTGIPASERRLLQGCYLNSAGRMAQVSGDRLIDDAGRRWRMAPVSLPLFPPFSLVELSAIVLLQPEESGGSDAAGLQRLLRPHTARFFAADDRDAVVRLVIEAGGVDAAFAPAPCLEARVTAARMNAAGPSDPLDGI